MTKGWETSTPISETRKVTKVAYILSSGEYCPRTLCKLIGALVSWRSSYPISNRFVSEIKAYKIEDRPVTKTDVLTTRHWFWLRWNTETAEPSLSAEAPTLRRHAG